MKSIRGKIALVTGAASGIGRAVALALAHHRGVSLHLVDVNEAGLAEAVADARQLGVEAVNSCCDLSRPEQVSAAVGEVLGRWGRLDLLVNNAGVAYYGPMERMTSEQWNWLLAVNLLAPIQLSRELLPALLSRPEAHIVNVCSIAGLVAGGRLTAYHTSKFGLVGFSEAMRVEYRSQGLGVTAVCPGLVQTNLFRAAVNGRGTGPLRHPPRWLCVSPETVADRVLRAIRRDQGLVLVGGMAHALWLFKRLSPRFLSFVAGWRRKKRRVRNEEGRPIVLAPPSSDASTTDAAQKAA